MSFYSIAHSFGVAYRLRPIFTIGSFDPSRFTPAIDGTISPFSFVTSGMKTIHSNFPFYLAFLALFSVSRAQSPTVAPDREKVLNTMKAATTFMTEKASYQGGFVWSYLPDLSRRWGEMEAFKTMLWMQSPGATQDVGDLLLDAYHVTKDEFYYQSAQKTADALIKVQHASGGWNYNGDLAGEESLKKWYVTIGRNGWRLEEFQHYYGNATFDDGVTADVSRFILRFYLEKHDAKYKPAVDKFISFIVHSQYPNGGWPQRFPPMGQFTKNGFPDYTGFVTFNDNVVADNVDLLITCYQVFGDASLLDSIHRGMKVYVDSQQPAPQAGWGLQHTPDDLKPASARTYEPKALTTHTTGQNIEELIKFYYLTGDKTFLARIPEALAWLDSVKLPANTPGARAPYPTFVEMGTNEPLYIHRSGSNVNSGRYFVDKKSEHTIGHYSSFRSVDVPALRADYEKALATPPEFAKKDSPLQPNAAAFAFPKILSKDFSGGPGGRGRSEPPLPLPERAAKLVLTLNAEGYWLAPLRSSSHPYKGDGPKEAAPGDFGSTQVGDEYDTSPFRATESVMGISTSMYISNMATLLRYVDSAGSK